jgi:hypothetical protein
MALSERFQSRPCRMNPPGLQVFESLADSLAGIRPRGKIEQPLISCGILQHGFSLAVDGQNQRPPGPLKPAHELRRFAPKARHRLYVSFQIKHALFFGTFKGVTI